jgi:hypothetical protein
MLRERVASFMPVHTLFVGECLGYMVEFKRYWYDGGPLKMTDWRAVRTYCKDCSNTHIFGSVSPGNRFHHYDNYDKTIHNSHDRRCPVGLTRSSRAKAT